MTPTAPELAPTQGPADILPFPLDRGVGEVRCTAAHQAMVVDPTNPVLCRAGTGRCFYPRY